MTPSRVLTFSLLQAPTGVHRKLKEVEEEVLGKAYDSRIMRRLLGYMQPYKTAVALSLVFLLFNSVLQVVGPLLTKVAVDRYLSPTGKSGWAVLDNWLSKDPWSGMTQISVLYLLSIVGALLFEFLQTYIMQCHSTPWPLRWRPSLCRSAPG